MTAVLLQADTISPGDKEPGIKADKAFRRQVYGRLSAWTIAGNMPASETLFRVQFAVNGPLLLPQGGEGEPHSGSGLGREFADEVKSDIQAYPVETEEIYGLAAENGPVGSLSTSAGISAIHPLIACDTSPTITAKYGSDDGNLWAVMCSPFRVFRFAVPKPTEPCFIQNQAYFWIVHAYPEPRLWQTYVVGYEKTMQNCTES
ncbi:hypothetical protein Bbelb_007780 [Branchiostoma belcheri]|nr:hypothetical protein Bbelb_007780 [Branchiostoma belcheri]